MTDSKAPWMPDPTAAIAGPLWTPAKQRETIHEVLEDRNKKYGTFDGLSTVAQALKREIKGALDLRGKVLPPDMQEALDLICTKIGRVVNGDHDHIDGWTDICGYSQLIVDRLNGVVR